MKLYRKNIKVAVAKGRLEYLRNHFIIAGAFWNVVDFPSVNPEVFDMLWLRSPAPIELLPFVVVSRRMSFLQSFVNYYGPTKCLRECVIQQWSEGVRLCLSEGAEVEGDSRRRDPVCGWVCDDGAFLIPGVGTQQNGCAPPPAGRGTERLVA